MHYDGDFSIGSLRAAYRGGISPVRVIETAYRRIAAASGNPIWICTRAQDEALAAAERLRHENVEALPLYGIPFAVKDNIDVAGLPTTAGCPDYSYLPSQSAPVVRALESAGALCLGKTNLDQFATGLVGTRSPYGVCRNAFDPRFISGGSSSGSALAVALEQVSFALGTDTAGSGRVPAAFNNVVGLKPTPGLLSTRGVVPACRSLDCIAIFALHCADAMRVLECAGGYDAGDPFSRRIEPQPARGSGRFAFAVPARDQLEFYGDADYEALYHGACTRLAAATGRTPVEIDFAPFLEAQRLLYEGPWLAEREVAFGAFAAAHPRAVHPVVREVLAGAAQITAADTFRAMYRLAELRRRSEQCLASVPILLLPATPTLYRIDEVEADPIALNVRLGLYTNFVNLLGLCALTLPAGFRGDGLPFGVSLIALPGNEALLAAIGAKLHAALGVGAGAMKRVSPAPCETAEPTHGYVRVAVVGAHLCGLPLNAQLTDRGARLAEHTRTAPCYRLYELATEGPVRRPGLVRVAPDEAGGSIEAEIWEMPVDRFGSFVADVPAPLGIGTVELAGGARAKGFLCEHYAVRHAEDITAWGSWRHWLDRSGERDPH